MGWIYRELVRPILYSYDAETVHEQTLNLLAKLSTCQGCRTLTRRVLGASPLSLPVKAFGLEFSNPVGLAAGLDKNAVALPIWPSFGFGFVEIGTVTANPQPGNPRPRIFRLPADEALLNRLGFPNEGADKIAERLAQFREKKLWPTIPVGINIGKSATVSLEDATTDYLRCFEKLREFGDFFIVNISSPNTPHLRELQERRRLEELIAHLQQANKKSTGTNQKKPILLKISPDLTFAQLDEVIEVCQIHELAGIVAANTTLDRSHLQSPAAALSTGGLSGRPVRRRATDLVHYITQQTRGKLSVIGVGGIVSGATAYEKIRAGASLVEFYTGFVYEGPMAVRKILQELRFELARDGFESIAGEVQRF